MYFTLVEWGVIVALLLSVMALAIAIFTRARVVTELAKARTLNQKMSTDLMIATTGSVGMGQRLMAMEKRLNEQTRPIKQTVSANVPSEVLTEDDAVVDEFQIFSDAVQLFKLGYKAEEVAKRCGLSLAEASLMEMMQQKTR